MRLGGLHQGQLQVDCYLDRAISKHFKHAGSQLRNLLPGIGKMEKWGRENFAEAPSKRLKSWVPSAPDSCP